MDLDILHWLYAGVLFAIGLTVGSFLNVVIYRMPLGISIISPPSTCPTCGNRIAPWDNVPLLGWLFLGGRCRTCRSPISARYPLVELATGILWGLTGWRLAGLGGEMVENIAIGVLALAFVSAMVVTFLVDWDHRIILDEISLGGLAAALLASVFLPGMHHAATMTAFMEYHPILDYFLGVAPPWLRGLGVSLTGALAGLAFSLFIYFAGNYAFREKIAEARKADPDIDSALGLGDVKLMTFFGAYMGWEAVLFIFIVGSILGAVVGSGMKYVSGDAEGEKGWQGLVRRWRTGDSVLPFGPFLVIGALLFFFGGDDLTAIARNVFSMT